MKERKFGVILSYISQGVYVLSSLVYTPVMLRILGQSEYGLYQLVNSTVAYLGLLSFGFSSCYIRFYSRYKVKGEDNEIANLNGLFLIVFTLISLISVIAGLILIVNVHNIFNKGLTLQELKTAKILMTFLIFNLAITFPNSIFDCILIAHEKFIFQKCMIIAKNILNPFLTLPLLLLGYGSIGMVFISTLITITCFIINVYYCINKLSSKFSFSNIKFSLFKEMFGFTFFVFLSMIVDQINWNVDKFLLGRYAGTTAVAVYGISAQLNSMYMHLSTSISSVFIPKVNMIEASNRNNDEHTFILTKVGRIQFVFLSLIMSGFVFFGTSFLNLWAGDGYSSSYSIALLLMLPASIPYIQTLGIEIQKSKNMHKARAIVYLIIAIANIFVSIPCVKIWGAQGAAIGTALTMLMGNCIFMNYYYHFKMNLNMIFFWKNIFSFWKAILISSLCGLLITWCVNINNYSTLFILAIVYALIYILLMWFFGLNDYEKNLIRNIIEICTGRRKNK